ncbi:MAG: hypothetical protein M0P69_14225 [Bacteroidales bacterium]|nr:hypothetical protein [Bacteroidales bacterium]
MEKKLGFDLRLQVGSKFIAGTTSDTFNIEGKRRESIMKSDQGNKQWENIGRAITFSANLYVMHGSDANNMTIQDVRQACAANTTGYYEYGGDLANDPIVTGNCMFLSISETSDSENFATATVNFEELEGSGGWGTRSSSL